MHKNLAPQNCLQTQYRSHRCRSLRFSELPFNIRLLLPNLKPLGFPGSEVRVLDFVKGQDHPCYVFQAELMTFPQRLPEQSTIYCLCRKINKTVCAFSEFSKGLTSQLAWNSNLNFYQELCYFKVLAFSQDISQGVTV